MILNRLIGYFEKLHNSASIGSCSVGFETASEQVTGARSIETLVIGFILGAGLSGECRYGSAF